MEAGELMQEIVKLMGNSHDSNSSGALVARLASNDTLSAAELELAVVVEDETRILAKALVGACRQMLTWREDRQTTSKSWPSVLVRLA